MSVSESRGTLGMPEIITDLSFEGSFFVMAGSLEKYLRAHTSIQRHICMLETDGFTGPM